MICKCGNEFEPHGHQHLCGSCLKEYKRAYYLANRDRILARTSEYRQRHSEWYRKYTRDYARGNKHKIRAYRSKLNYYLSKLLSRAKTLARDNGLPININLQLLKSMWGVQDGRCKLTGMRMAHEHNNIRSVSIDRINSKLGYTSDNIQLVCKWVNLAKNNSDNQAMIDVIEEIRHG